MKRCSSLAIKERKIKNTMRYFYTPIRMVRVENNVNTEWWWVAYRPDHACIASGNGKRHGHSGAATNKQPRHCTTRLLSQKNEDSCSHRNLYICSSFICNNPNLKLPRCLSVGE